MNLLQRISTRLTGKPRNSSATGDGAAAAPAAAPIFPPVPVRMVWAEPIQPKGASHGKA